MINILFEGVEGMDNKLYNKRVKTINILLIKIILNRLKNYILEVIVKIIMLVELFLKIIILKLGEVNLEKGVIRNYDCKSDLEGCYKTYHKVIIRVIIKEIIE